MNGGMRQTPSVTQRLKFSVSEDIRLVGLVNQAMAEFGVEGIDWKQIGQMMDKTARQCRDRYRNYLSPDIVNGPWSDEEDAFLKEKVESLGCHWSMMTKYFPGRSDVNLKNRWSILKDRNVETRKSIVSLRIENFSISETVHSFVGEKIEPQKLDWFDAIFAEDVPSSFLAENGFGSF